MTGDAICDEHHVARHLSGSRIEKGTDRPARGAFLPKDDEREVSVGWLEFDGGSDQEAQLDRVRGFMGARRMFRNSCRLAVLSAGAARRVVREALEDCGPRIEGEPLRIIEDPVEAEPADPSHALIVLPELPQHRELAAVALKDLVRREDMHEARVEAVAKPPVAGSV